MGRSQRSWNASSFDGHRPPLQRRRSISAADYSKASRRENPFFPQGFASLRAYFTPSKHLERDGFTNVVTLGWTASRRAKMSRERRKRNGTQRRTDAKERQPGEPAGWCMGVFPNDGSFFGHVNLRPKIRRLGLYWVTRHRLIRSSNPHDSSRSRRRICLSPRPP